MQARLILPAIVAAAVLTAGGAFWASAGEGHHTPISDITLGQTLGSLAGIHTSPTPTTAATPTAGRTTSPAAVSRPKSPPKTAPTPLPSAAPAHSATHAAAQPGGSLGTITRPAPPSGDSAAPVPGSTVTAIDSAVFNLLNRERGQNHEPPLRWSPQLFCAAAEHTSWMDAENTLAHNFPGEPSFAARISACGFQGSTTAENIGMSYDLSEQGALALEDYMYTEPHLPCPPGGCEIGHRRNILSPSFTYVGLSVIMDQRTGALWLTENFGG